ncbi:hypothetical protein [Enterovirga rhinocerotis]|uniref:Head-tail adaptor n=1 Tax=Enterovirga rhinocerotis TaxID=1339210 RepID=A0A4R7C8A7_9HYPH|nr:hypothetical protein [Enterovirga rhinocerotis]TDR94202.1 hypothetical protein EV668_1481 [Enterovirga rhinocerotis]
MQPGRLNTRVAISQRAIVDGMRQGDPAPAFSCWGRWAAGGARTLEEAGSRTDAVAGVLTVNDTPRNRTIALDDRVAFRGADLVVASAPIPDGTGFLAIQLSRQVGAT